MNIGKALGALGVMIFVGNLSVSAQNGQQQTKLPAPVGKWRIAFSLPTKERPQKMIFSPDGRSLYVLLGTQVQKWDLKNRKKLWTYKDPNEIFDFALDPAGKRLALATSSWLSLMWGGDYGATIASFPVKTRAVAFSRDGKWLASASDNAELTGKLPTRLALVLWRNDDWFRAKTMLTPIQNGYEKSKESFRATALDFSPDGQKLVVTTSVGILWACAVAGEGSGAAPLYCPSRFVRFAPDGKTAIGQWENVVTSESSNPVMSLFDPKTWKQLDSPRYPPNDSITASGAFTGANAIAYAPDSQTIAASFADGFLGLFDTQSGKLKETLASARTQYGISSLAFSPDGQQLASISWKQVDFWEKKGA